MYFLSRLFPNWRHLSVYEAGSGGAASRKLRGECAGYVSSQFFRHAEPGSVIGGVRAENLECLTFPDESFDLVVTQDVLEHILRPDRAFAEIARVLRPGGAHLFTVPFFRGRATVVRAVPEEDGSVRHLLPPDYHAGPVDPDGSLVIREWGDDMLWFIEEYGGMQTAIQHLRNRKLGLDGQFLEVFVSRRTALTSSFPRAKALPARDPVVGLGWSAPSRRN